MTSIEEIYKDLSSSAKNTSMMVPHMPYLRELAGDCDHITNLGVHYGLSLIAFLSAQPKKLIAVDIAPCPIVSRILPIQGLRTQFSFIEGDSRLVDLEETDLLFIDTTHTYDHLKAELTKHAQVSRQYIVFHDTTIAWTRGFWFRDVRKVKTFGEGVSVRDKGRRRVSQGIGKAIEEFLNENKNWRVHFRTKLSAGMMTLKRMR